MADVFDALTSPRVYKPAFPLEKALAIMEEGRGTQFDPKCLEVFFEALPEVKEVLKKYNPDALKDEVDSIGRKEDNKEFDKEDNPKDNIEDIPEDNKEDNKD